MTELSLSSWSRGRHQPALSHEFASLWKTVFRNVWAQWRFENDDPEYFGPSFEVSPVSAAASPVAAEQGEVDTLAFCGGGKDSLVAMKLKCS